MPRGLGLPRGSSLQLVRIVKHDDLANARGFPGIFSLSLTAEFLAQNYSYTLADRGVHGSWSDCIRREIFPSPKKSVIKITDAREIFFDFILHL